MLAKLGLALGVPLVFFLLLEAGLRVGGFGRNTDYFIPDREPGFYRSNPRFTELFFPASFGLKPLNFRLPREKPPGSYRVFVVGESAAMGVPEPAFALSPLLQAQLRTAHPDRRIDVYNLGITAINSHAIWRIVREAAGFHPDLFVVYMGNNEVVGPFGASSVVTRGTPPLALVRAGLWARSTRVGQLLQFALGLLRPAASGFEDWRGMEMFAGKTVAPGDPRLARIYANFAANLADILASARAHGIKTILSTVAVNVKDCAPFASQPAPELSAAQVQRWRQAMDAGELASDLGQTPAARSFFEQALAIDPRHADANFQLARTLEALGELPAARQHYLVALQQDALRFRADPEINDLIRQAARAAPEGVTLVDAARAFGSDPASTGAPAGREFFFEHVHFRWEGNCALARLLAPAAAHALFGAGGTAAPWLDDATCAQAVGFTDFGRIAMLRSMAELTSRPPFTGESRYAQDRAWFAAEIAGAEAALAVPGAPAAAVERANTALARDPGNPLLLFQTAAVRLQAGDLVGALALQDSLAAALPPSPERAVQRAYLLEQAGRTDEAEALLLESARSEPYYFQTYGSLARLWAVTGRTSRSLDYFARQVTRLPGSRAVRSAYAQALARNGDAVAAEGQLRAILRQVPDDESALAPLLDRLQHTGRGADAVALMRDAYAYNPRSFSNNARLVRYYSTQGEAAAVVTFLQALAASGPVTAQLYVDLARNLAKLGRLGETRVALARARWKAEMAGDPALIETVDALIRQYGS